MRAMAGRSALVMATSLIATSLVATSGQAQERNLTLSGRGTLEGERGNTRDVREVRLTLRRNADFAATVVLRNSTVVLRGTWRRQGMGNVDRIELREAEGGAVRGEGMLAYADRDAMIPQRLSLSWSGRAGVSRLEVEDRTVIDEGDRPDRPDRPGRPGRLDSWSAGAGSQVYRNLDSRAVGDGFARMSGVRGGAFSIVRARIGTGGEVVLDVDEPTKGEIRGRVRRVQERRVEVSVSAIFGYTASGTLTVVLRDADEVQRIDGDGSGERGAWTLEFRGRGLPNDYRPGLGGGEGPFGGASALDGDERGRGTLAQDVGPTLEITRARVELDDDRSGRLLLESRRERVSIEGRWTSTGGRVEFDIRRINDRVASGRLTIRREGRSFSTIDGEGRTSGGRFSLVFAAR